LKSYKYHYLVFGKALRRVSHFVVNLFFFKDTDEVLFLIKMNFKIKHVKINNMTIFVISL